LVPELTVHQLVGDLLEHWERLASLPYWGHPWPGGQALARYLLDHPEAVRGRQVLDLASGSGLVAIAAARAGAARVVAADVDPLALAAIELNAAVNGVRVTGCGRDLLDDDPTGPPDVVLAGDVCYQADLARRVLRFGRRAAAGGALVLLGDPGRSYLPDTGLQPLATVQVPTPEGLERAAVTTATVWRLVPPAEQDSAQSRL
jgi:predicted nicotinamide N-methyase